MYDSDNFVMGEENSVREYFMFAVEKTNEASIYGNKSEVFQINNNLFLMRKN